MIAALYCCFDSTSWQVPSTVDSNKKGQSLINILLPPTKSILTQNQPAWLRLCFRTDKLGISFSSLALLGTPVPKQGHSRYLSTAKNVNRNGSPKQEKDLESLGKHWCWNCHYCWPSTDQFCHLTIFLHSISVIFSSKENEASSAFSSTFSQ